MDSCTVVGPSRVEICQNGDPDVSTFVNFTHFILSGDTSGTWTDMGHSGATGAFPMLEFTRVEPGNYLFQYKLQTLNYICKDSVFAIEIVVKNCKCPSLVLDTIPAVCQSEALVNLDFLTKNEPGFWKIVGAPNGSRANISDKFFDATTSFPGSYVLAFEFSNLPLATCPMADSVLIQVNKPFFEKITATPPVCFGEKNGEIRIDSVTSALPPFIYSFDNQAFSTDFVFGKLAPGNHTIKIQDAAGCESDTVLTLAEPLQLTIFAGPDTTGFVGDSIQIIPQTNFDVKNFIWSGGNICPDCWEQTLELVADSRFRLTAFDEKGCKAEAGFCAKVRHDLPVFFPNIFRPNPSSADGLFYPKSLAGLANKMRRFAVWSRWGELVFSVENAPLGDISSGWDGRFRGKICPSGVYLWSAEVVLADGTAQFQQGNVTVIR